MCTRYKGANRGLTIEFLLMQDLVLFPWMGGPPAPDQHNKSFELRVWRWGASLLPWRAKQQPRDIVFRFLQKQRKEDLEEANIQPPSVR